MENIDFRELKNDSFLSHEGQPEVIGKLSDVTCQRNSGDVFQNWVFAVLVKKTREFFLSEIQQISRSKGYVTLGTSHIRSRWLRQSS